MHSHLGEDGRRWKECWKMRKVDGMYKYIYIYISEEQFFVHLLSAFCFLALAFCSLLVLGRFIGSQREGSAIFSSCTIRRHKTPHRTGISLQVYSKSGKKNSQEEKVIYFFHWCWVRRQRWRMFASLRKRYEKIVATRNGVSVPQRLDARLHCVN
jgi:hypothetical protein